MTFKIIHMHDCNSTGMAMRFWFIFSSHQVGYTALQLSSMNGHTATVVALLERGADINARDIVHVSERYVTIQANINELIHVPTIHRLMYMYT